MSPEEIEERLGFEKELEHLINRYSKENESDTPDYILAKFITNCLNAWNVSIKLRDKHSCVISKGEGYAIRVNHNKRS